MNTTTHGQPNAERFARVLLELLAEQEGLCVTEVEVVSNEQ